MDIEDSEGIDPKDKIQAINAKAAASNAASADKAAVELTGGNRPIDEVIQKSQGDLIKVRQIINQGGFSGPERDKYVISLHHAEWVQSRNAYIDCDDNTEKKSVEYTALVKGKAQSHEIIKAHKEWENVRDKCKKIGDDVTEKAKQYVETDRRVRENKKAESEIFPVIEGFQISREGVKEGFNFYDTQDVIINNTKFPNTDIFTYNSRLPLFKDTVKAQTGSQQTTILPWVDYYVNCDDQTDSLVQTTCKNAENKKNDYAVAINREFQRANNLLNTYYNVSNKSDNQSRLTLLEEPDIKSILENQKKNIAIVIILGIYPKFILPVVLWLLDVLTKSTEMLGLKNVRFWK